jgi:ATP-dependent Clp protease ATP-binding subunit ClpC
MTDGQGRTVDFRNTVIIMTSNLGTDFTKRGGALGFIRDGSEQAIADHQKIEKAMRDTFRPEFLNRVDEIIIFSPLTKEEVEQIVEIQMQGVHKRLLEGGLEIHLSAKARQWLAEKGFDAQYGARPLRRAIQRFVENPLSIKLLKGDFVPGDVVMIDAGEGELTFNKPKRKTGRLETPVEVPPAPKEEAFVEKFPEPENNLPPQE